MISSATRADVFSIAQASTLAAGFTGPRRKSAPECLLYSPEEAGADAACNRDYYSERKRRAENAESCVEAKEATRLLQEDRDRLRRELDERESIEATHTRDLVKLLLPLQSSGIDDVRTELEILMRQKNEN